MQGQSCRRSKDDVYIPTGTNYLTADLGWLGHKSYLVHCKVISDYEKSRILGVNFLFLNYSICEIT